MQEEQIIKILSEIQTEQQSQRELIEQLQKSVKNAGGISKGKIIFYLIFGTFAAGAMYFYYSTITNMF